MIRTLLPPARGSAERTADGLRVLAALCIVVAGIGWGPASGASLAGVTAGMFLPRLLRVRASFDIAFGIVVLVAVWSSVLEIYITTRWWDVPMHFLTNGLWAAVVYISLVRLGVIADAATLPRPMLSAAVMTTALGFTLGVIWEFWEWIGHTYIDEGILVGYADTVGDLFWGGVGALVAGLFIPFLTNRSVRPESAPRAAAH